MRDAGSDTIGDQWKQVARRTATRLRFGAALQATGPAVVIAAVALFGLCLAGRLCVREWLWTLLTVGTFILVCAVCFLFAAEWRANRLSIPAAFARIDRVLGLNNALSAAAAGRGRWPALSAGSDDLLRFNWRRILPPYGLWVLLTATGLLVPLPAGALDPGEVPPPRSHETIAALIVELEKAGVLNPEEIEQLQQRLDGITNQPAENWYRHSSLEAADHLQTSIRDQLNALESGLNRTVASLAALENAHDSAGSANQQQLASEFKSALQNLKLASPGLNQKLMESLSALDPGQLKSLKSGEYRNVLEQLKAAAAVCRNCQGNGRGGTKSGNGEAQSELDELLGSGTGSPAEPRTGGGRMSGGGVERGPGVAALPLSRNPTELATNRPESLNAPELDRARPGDVIGSSEAEYEPDKTPAGLQNGGGAAAGQGGKPVSRDVLLPEEKAILRAYFR